MLEYITLILLCQLAGEFTITTLGIPIPGPVAGMVLLFILLVVNKEIPKDLDNVANGLLGNLSLMFVPAGVGVMAHFELLGTDGLALTIAIIGSTLLTIAVTAKTMSYLARFSGDNTGHTSDDA